jgi:hypothetical protein
MPRARWRWLAKGLMILAGLLFVGSFVSLTLLQLYYPGHRPHAPQRGSGQTTKLPWTNPVSYGTARDASLTMWCFWSGFYAMVPFGLGWAIRIYILGEDGPPTRGTPPRFGTLSRQASPDDPSQP